MVQCVKQLWSFHQLAATRAVMRSVLLKWRQLAYTISVCGFRLLAGTLCHALVLHLGLNTFSLLFPSAGRHAVSCLSTTFRIILFQSPVSFCWQTCCFVPEWYIRHYSELCRMVHQALLRFCAAFCRELAPSKQLQLNRHFFSAVLPSTAHTHTHKVVS